MTKFETIKGTLCRMVEPTPLTPEATFPCMVRLIQDDSRMGMFNRDTKPSRLSDFYLVARIVSNNIVVDEFIESDYNRFEIIGYPVADGSKDWALYQMMQGEKVFRVEWECNMYCQYTNNEIITFRYGISSTINPVEEWIANAKRADFGWQIYKEPKPEPAKEQFEVGDWVEFIDAGGRKSQGKYLSNTDGNAIIVLDTACNMRVVVRTTKIIRKLSQSEIVVRIGCLRGTVKRWDSTTFHMFHGNSKFSKISFDALDNETRELVESLLEAMQGEKK